jgi:acetolactate synthase-1/2/3 large subunit
MNPKLAKRLQDADCILLLGAELRDIATAGYTLLDPLTEPKTIIQIHPDADHIGRVYPAKMGIVARAPDALAKLRGLPPMISSWSDWTRTARSDYEDWQRLAETPGDVRMEDVVRYLSDALPENAILTNGAGNYAAWVHRYFTFKTYGTQVAPTSGSMGYGFPAAISAKLHYPDRPVICFAGDGCFQMTCNEFSTAVQHGANVITIVANNGRYGTIRMHQEKTYPGRVSGTDLANPDFAAFAHAYGGHGETVTRSEDFADAFQRCLDADKPCIIELKLDSEALATGFTLSEARKMGEAQS